MKYVKQTCIITGMTLAGEILGSVLPLPVPAGVYGLFLMLAALISGAVKLESVEGTGNFLLDTMSLMFIPSMVGVVECLEELRAVLVPFLLIILASTVVVMCVTGWPENQKMRGGRANERVCKVAVRAVPVLWFFYQCGGLSVRELAAG